MRSGRCVFAFLLLAALLISAAALADAVYLKEGGKLEGKIVSESETELKIATKFGIQTVPKESVARTEQTPTVLEEYESRRKEIAQDDAEGHYQLALWCRENGLLSKYNLELRDAILTDPNHEGARVELGYVFYGGRWVHTSSLEQLFKEKNLVAYKGRVITREEYAKRIAEEAPKQPETPAPEQTKPPQLPEQEDPGVLWEEAFKIPSAHYIVKCNCARKRAERYSRLMEELYSKYRKAFSGYSVRIKGRSQVWVFRNQQEFMTETGRAQDVGGYYDPLAKIVATYRGQYGTAGNTDSVLARQGCYQYLDLIMADLENAPAWLVEGFACTFESYEISESGRVTETSVPRELLILLQQSFEKGSYIKVTDIIRRGKQRFTKQEEAHAWGLVHYMKKSGSKNADILNRYLKSAAGYSATGAQAQPQQPSQPRQPASPGQPAQPRQSGRQPSLAEQFEQIVGDMNAFEAAWKKWILKLEVPPPGEISGNTFKSSKFRFEIAKPADWAFETAGSQVGFQVSAIKKNSKLSVFVFANPSSQDAKTIAEQREQQLRREYAKVEKNETTIGGEPAIELTFSDEDKRQKFAGDTSAVKKYKYVFIASKEFVFMLVSECFAATFAEDAKTLDQIAATFKLLR
jgi:hypothetical protein